MVSILLQRHLKRRCLYQENWATQSVPATTFVITQSFARYDRDLDQNTPLGES